MSTPQDSGLRAGHKSMTTEIAFRGRNRGKRVGDVRGRAAAGDLLLINEPLDALGVCSSETAALRPAKKEASWPSGSCHHSNFDQSWTDNCS